MYLSCWGTGWTWTQRWGWGGLLRPPSPLYCCGGSSQTCTDQTGNLHMQDGIFLNGDWKCCSFWYGSRGDEDVYHCPSSPSLISWTTSPLLTDSSWGPAFSQSAITVYFPGACKVKDQPMIQLHVSRRLQQLLFFVSSNNPRNMWTTWDLSDPWIRSIWDAHVTKAISF